MSDRLAQVGPIVERGQLPRGTSAAELIEYEAAPLYYRLLITAEPLTEATADLAAAAASAASRAGVFTSVRTTARPPGRPSCMIWGGVYETGY